MSEYKFNSKLSKEWSKVFLMKFSYLDRLYIVFFGKNRKFIPQSFRKQLLKLALQNFL